MAKKENNNSRSQQPAERDRKADILGILRAFPDKKFTMKNLAAASGGADRQGRYRTAEILGALVADGTVEECSGKKYRLGTRSLPSYEGVADMISSGAIYVRVEDFDEDIYVHRRNTLNALNGDVVEVAVTRTGRSGRSPEGEIKRIVRRNPKG